MRVWHAVEVVALGLWVGALVGFGAITAPLLFRIVASRQVAGNVAGQVVLGLELAGLVCLGLTALALLVQARGSRRSGPAGAAVAGAVDVSGAPGDGIVAAATGAGSAVAGSGAGRRRPVGLMLRLLLVVAALLTVLVDLTWVRWGLNLAQAAMDKPIELYAENDPKRVEYNVWHQRSRSASNVYVLLAGAALVWAAATPARPRHTGGDGP